jgi:hypothetical protein
MRESEEGGSKAEKLEARQSADTEVLALDSPSNHGGRKIGRAPPVMAGLSRSTRLAISPEAPAASNFLSRSVFTLK